MKYNFEDFTGTIWTTSQVDAYNRKITTYNYAVKNQPNSVTSAREAVSNAFPAFCSDSVVVRG